MSKQFYFKQISLTYKKILFQRTQFSISTHFSSIWPINRTLWGATTLGYSGPRNDGNEGVLHICQSTSITRTSPSDCLVSYSGYLLRWGGSYPSAEKLLVYSTTPANWAKGSLNHTFAHPRLQLKTVSTKFVIFCTLTTFTAYFIYF